MKFIVLGTFILTCLLLRAQQFEEVHGTIQLFESSNDTDLASGISCADLNGDGVEELIYPTDAGLKPHIYTWQTDHYVLLDISAFTFELWNSSSIYAADYDNDGDRDLLICNINSPNSMYRNDGDFSFTDVTSQANIIFEFSASYGAVFTDIDRDGWLDIYVINRSENDNPMPNRLYKNLGNGTFIEMSSVLGIADESGASMAVGALDFNNDLWPDIYVANDRFTGNKAFLNNGDGTFTDISVTANCDLDYNYMSVSAHDVDGNGYDDIYASNTQQGNALLMNAGDLTFSEEVMEYALGVNALSWGSHFFDADNDGDRDLYVATFTPDMQHDAFFSCEDGAFIRDSLSFPVINPNSGMGVISLDYDLDGDLDLALTNGGGQLAWMYENEGNSNFYLNIDLVGTISNADGIGAWVEVWSNGNVQREYTRCGGDYAAQSSHLNHFGLGNAQADSVMVSWPSGIVQILESPPINATLSIVEMEPETENEVEAALTTSINDPVAIGWLAIHEVDLNKTPLSLFDSQGKLVVVNSYTKLMARLNQEPRGVYHIAYKGSSIKVCSEQ